MTLDQLQADRLANYSVDCKSRCEKILKGDIEAHWPDWAEWLLVDKVWGLTSQPLATEAEIFIKEHALRVMRGGERDSAYAAAYSAADMVCRAACRAADRAAYWVAYRASWVANRAPYWAAGWAAERAERAGRIDFWPRLRSRIGLDLDHKSHHPFHTEILSTRNDWPVLIYLDWLEETLDADLPT